MSLGSIVRNSIGRHGSWMLVHHHRLECGYLCSMGWDRAAFGNLYMEAILSCGVPRTLNTFWDITYKLKTGGADGSQELSVKYIKGDK